MTTFSIPEKIFLKIESLMCVLRAHVNRTLYIYIDISKKRKKRKKKKDQLYENKKHIARAKKVQINSSLEDTNPS